MSVQPSEGLEGTPVQGGAESLLGPANAVMSAIFNDVDFEEGLSSEQGSEDLAGASGPEAGTQPAVAGKPAEESSVSTEAGEAEGGVAGGEPAGTPPSGEPLRAPVTNETQHYANEFTRVADALEERFLQSYQQVALDQMQADYGQYIERLSRHPMELVGQELPAIDGTDGTLIFGTVQEARDWQDAVKTILRREVQLHVQQQQEEYSDVRETLHSSIQLFRDNPDLIPGSQGFNKELADEVAKMARPYALKMDGKLTGYSIPIQGIVDQVRGNLKARAAAAPAAPPPAPAKRKTSPPQGGLPSRAASDSGGDEDFSPMWKVFGIDSAPI